MHSLPRPAAPVNQRFPFVVADWMSLILITEVEPLRENGDPNEKCVFKNKRKKHVSPCTSGTYLYCNKDRGVWVIIKDKHAS